MHSSMARCSQSQPAAPTDEIDANGRTKRAASRVKGACAARTDQRRTTRRYPRPEHSRPRLRRPCGPPERGGVEASQNPGHRGRGSQAVRTARSRACVRQRAQSVQGTCKGLHIPASRRCWRGTRRHTLPGVQLTPWSRVFLRPRRTWRCQASSQWAAPVTWASVRRCQASASASRLIVSSFALKALIVHQHGRGETCAEESAPSRGAWCHWGS